MTALIKQKTLDGTVRRCDERCYNALGPVCKCVCGGRNHGVGLKQAVENTCEDILDLLAKEGTIVINKNVIQKYRDRTQLSIFPAESPQK